MFNSLDFQNCVYILKSLPFDLWLPEAKDLEKIRSWFLENPLNSLQHQMAKAVISKMNFDICQVSDTFNCLVSSRFIPSCRKQMRTIFFFTPKQGCTML